MTGVYDLVHPGGNPDALHAAAWAATQLAERIRTTLLDLGEEVYLLGQRWQGVASENFATTCVTFVTAALAYADHLDSIASVLNAAATEVARVNTTVQAALIEIPLTIAAGAAFTFVTVTLSDEAAAARISAICARIVRLVAALTSTLKGLALRLGAVLTRLHEVSYGLSSAALLNLVGTAMTKWLSAGSPFSGWSRQDLLEIAVATGIGAAVDAKMPGTGVAKAIGSAAVASTATSLADKLAIERQPVNAVGKDTAWDVAVATILGGASEIRPGTAAKIAAAVAGGAEAARRAAAPKPPPTGGHGSDPHDDPDGTDDDPDGPDDHPGRDDEVDNDVPKPTIPAPATFAPLPTVPPSLPPPLNGVWPPWPP